MEKSELSLSWELLKSSFERNFADGDKMDLDGIIFLIGIQELGFNKRKFKKDEKIQVMHVAICRLLEPYGYYKYLGLDEDGWPHYQTLQVLPNLKPGEQTLLMKKAVVSYAKEQKWI